MKRKSEERPRIRPVSKTTIKIFCANTGTSLSSAHTWLRLYPRGLKSAWYVTTAYIREAHCGTAISASNHFISDALRGGLRNSTIRMMIRRRRRRSLPGLMEVKRTLRQLR